MARRPPSYGIQALVLDKVFQIKSKLNMNCPEMFTEILLSASVKIQRERSRVFA